MRNDKQSQLNEIRPVIEKTCIPLNREKLAWNATKDKQLGEVREKGQERNPTVI